MDDDSSLHKNSDSDSIVRGILGNSIKYNHEKQTGSNESSSSTLVRLLNGNNDTPRRTVSQQAKYQIPSNPEAIQQQHFDFIKKYKAGKINSDIF